jgi:hypothetical protein
VYANVFKEQMRNYLARLCSRVRVLAVCALLCLLCAVYDLLICLITTRTQLVKLLEKQSVVDAALVKTTVSALLVRCVCICCVCMCARTHVHTRERTIRQCRSRTPRQTVGKKLEYFLATGNVVSESGLDWQQSSGCVVCWLVCDE